MSNNIQLKNLNNNVSGIYKLNYPNGKIYIGQSIDIKRRMYEHNNSKRLETHSFNPPCDLAILKYGKFEEIEILELLPPDKKILNEREVYWISYYQSNNKEIGYNLTPGGSGFQGEDYSQSVFSNEEVLDIRKRRFLGERKKDVYQDYNDRSFGTFEGIWLGRGYKNVGQEYFIEPNKISRQEYSSKANRGENNNKAKLTEKDVRQIRERFDKGETVAEIAKDFQKVNKNSIRRVCKRETWKNVI